MRCRAKHLSRPPAGPAAMREWPLEKQGGPRLGLSRLSWQWPADIRAAPGGGGAPPSRAGAGGLTGGHRRPAVESQTPSAPSRTHRSATGCSCPFEGPGQGRRAGAGAAESARVIWATAAPVLLPKGRHARGRAVPPVPTHSTRKQRRRRGAGSGGGTSRFRQARWIGFGPATKFSLSVCVAEILMKLNRNR